MAARNKPPAVRTGQWAAMLARLGWNRTASANGRDADAAKRREAILYLSHFCSPPVLREVARLRAELDRHYEIFVAGYCRSPGAFAGIDTVPALEYSADEIMSLPYPAKVSRFDPDNFFGNADLPLMRFLLERPDYDYYWLIEYDVRFSGAWPQLFTDLSSSSADLLCATMQTWTENSNWAHWDTLVSAGEEVPPERRVKGFMPFLRASRALRKECDARYRRGWGGHHEVLWPTIASLAGFGLEDIGGNGHFTPAARRGRYYHKTASERSQFPGTFVFRSSFADHNLFGPECHFKGTLWHPVKE